MPEQPMWPFSAQGYGLGSQQTLDNLAHLFPPFSLSLYQELGHRDLGSNKNTASKVCYWRGGGAKKA